MLEMLSPSPMDIVRFAAQTLQFRYQIQKLHKTNPVEAFELAADRFLSPPASARVTPNLARVRDDGKRFFKMKSKQWQQIEPMLKQVIDDAELFSLLDRGEKVQCYRWSPLGNKNRGRIVLSHGWEGYAFNFAALIAKARDQGWEVIGFDHLAHANSGGKHSGIPIALGTLLTVAQHIGKVDILIGHSLGASAVVWAAANKKILCKRVVLLAPFFDTLQLTRMWAKAHLLSEDIRAGMQIALEKTTDLRFDAFMPKDLSTKISMPVLVIHDPKDPVTAFKYSSELANLNKKVTLQVAPDTGHVRLLAEAQYIEQLLEFCRAGKLAG